MITIMKLSKYLEILRFKIIAPDDTHYSNSKRWKTAKIKNTNEDWTNHERRRKHGRKQRKNLYEEFGKNKYVRLARPSDYQKEAGLNESESFLPLLHLWQRIERTPRMLILVNRIHESVVERTRLIISQMLQVPDIKSSTPQFVYEHVLIGSKSNKTKENYGEWILLLLSNFEKRFHTWYEFVQFHTLIEIFSIKINFINVFSCQCLWTCLSILLVETFIIVEFFFLYVHDYFLNATYYNIRPITIFYVLIPPKGAEFFTMGSNSEKVRQSTFTFPQVIRFVSCFETHPRLVKRFSSWLFLI